MPPKKQSMYKVSKGPLGKNELHPLDIANTHLLNVIYLSTQSLYVQNELNIFIGTADEMRTAEPFY